ncbi:MAG TPA: dienelactone hydrolase family protein [Dehalococcoidia bacterium]|nr:dienelactone hydrolase family protein [Dehalococcoidia bacterium]
MNLVHSRRIVALLGVLALALAACSGGGAKDATPTAPAPRVPPAASWEAATQPGPFAVGVTTVEVVDTSRPTAANGSFPGSPERRMKVEVWYPAVPDASRADGRDLTLDASDAPYPLIVFAHGFTASRVQSTTYTRHLASHGYVVAAPDFPLTSGGAPGGPRIADLVNQPKDVSFVIDRMLAFSDEDGNRFHGAIDAAHIGLTGHSLGAFTTILALYGPDRDPRIDAALPLSGSGCLLTPGETQGVTTPVMFMIGSDDLIVAPAGNRRAYDLAHAPRYWVELVGGGHVRFADADIDDARVLGPLQRVLSGGNGGASAGTPVSAPTPRAGDVTSCAFPAESPGDPPITLARQQELLRAFATPFFDAYLRGSADAERFLDDDLPALTKDAVKYEFDVGASGQ